MRYRTACLICGALSWACAQSAPAQDVEPRVFSPAPVGTNIAGLSFLHSWGAVTLDKAFPVDDLEGSTYSLVASYARYIDFFGLSSRVSLAVPFATGDWDVLVGEDSVATDVKRTGFGDALASMTVFLVGAPAMTPKDFRDYERKTIFGFDLRLSVPVGQYDPDKLINLGSNRWRVTTSLGVSHPMGKWTAEAYTGAWFFTDNTSALGDNVLSQAPLVAFQLLGTFGPKPGMWFSAGLRQTVGGRPSVNDVELSLSPRKTRAGLVIALPVARGHTVKLIGSLGMLAEAGTNFRTVALQWAYVW